MPEIKAVRRYQQLFTVFLFLLLLFAAFELSGLREHFSLDFLRHRIIEHQRSGLLVFVLLFCLGNLIQVPGWLFLAAAVLALGQFWGGVVTYVAASISCVFTFLTIRWIGGAALRKLNSRIVTGLLGKLDAQPVTSIFFLRILFQTVPALNYTLAMSGVGFREYLVGTLLGLPLPIALYCIFFEYLARALGIA
ncbi:MAG: VTT domain-containing protein [Rhodocyclales bacterium]|nr:VTT domain-containing protein [Rhodocyclales bacterium]